MTFSINFSNVSRRTTGLNIFEESYNVLLGFGMIIENNSLKWAGQCPKVIYILVMLTILVRHFLFLTTNFRCFHEMWFRLGVVNCCLEFFMGKMCPSNNGFRSNFV